MADSQIDIFPFADVSLDERNGVVVGLRRSSQVTGLDTAGQSADEKFLSLYEALTSAGVTAGSRCTDHDDLLLTGRSARMIDTDKAMVDLTYEHFMISNAQNLAEPVHGELFYRTLSSLNTVETQKDGDGLQITVLHLYPETGKEALKYAGTAVSQGGMISVTENQMVKTLTGIMETSLPDDVTDGLLNKINSTPWQGSAATTWKCTAANHEPWSLETATRTHSFFFEFTRDLNGHDPDVIFIDEDTGRPPTNLTADGAKTVEYYTQVDFNTYFQDGAVDPEPD